ncbi:unnamed protein product [Closterium sp. NIES-53]
MMLFFLLCMLCLLVLKVTVTGVCRLTQALHTFTLDSGASRCFFRDSTTLTPLPAPLPVRLADPSEGLVVARSSTVLPCQRFRPAHCQVFTSPRSLRTWSLPPLPPSPAPPCLPCVEGRQRAAPHSSSFPPTTVPLQTLHMDVWGLTRVSGQGRERYFLLVVDDYMRYTTVFPLRGKGQVVDVLIPWIRAVRLQLRERFHQDHPVLRLHSDRGGEFSSDLLRDFCRGEGILQSFTLPHSPQQNGITERRTGLVMEYAEHQLNLWPRVSLPENSPTLRWTGEVGEASVFRVWGSRTFVRDTSADKLSARAIPCVFLSFPPDAPGWQFSHPTSRRVFPSQDVPFDESVPFYRLFPYHSAPPPPPPLFLAPGPPPVDPLPPQGPAPSGLSQIDPQPGTMPVEPGGAEPGGAEPAGVEPGDAESEGVEFGGAEPREWFAQRTRLESGAAGAGDPAAGNTGAGGAGVTARAGGTRGAATAGPGGAHTRGIGAAGTGSVGGAGAGGAAAREPAEPGGVGSRGTGAGGAGARGARAGGAVSGGTGAGGTVRPRPHSRRYSQPPHCLLLLLTLSRPEALQSVLSQSLALPRLFTLFARVPRARPPPVPGTHIMALRPSSVPLRVSLPAPPESSLRAVPDPESDLARATSPTVSRLLATVVTDPSFESTAATSLVAELVDIAVACRLEYATALVAESASPPYVGGECALGPDVLEDRHEELECLAAAVPRFASMLLAPEGDPDAPDIPTPRSYAEAITGPYSSQWQAAMYAEMASWKSTSTYVDAVPPSRANIVDGMWIFRVKWPPGSPPTFKACYVARGFSQRQGVDYFHTFSPTPKMTTLRVLLHVAAQRDYELHSLDFSTAFLQGSLHEEIWLRYPVAVVGRRLLFAHPYVRQLLLKLADVQGVGDLVRPLDEVPCPVGGVEVLPARLQDDLHAWRAAPRDDREGQQLHSTKLRMQVGVVFLRRRHSAPGEADQPGHLQLGLNGFLPGEDVRSTNKQGGDRDPVRQQHGVDFFHTFSPTPKMTTLRVLLHVVAQRDYELHSLDFSISFLQGSLHKEIWLRGPPGFTGPFPASTKWSLCRPVYGLRQAPREWHDTLRTTLAALGFAPSTADPLLTFSLRSKRLPRLGSCRLSVVSVLSEDSARRSFNSSLPLRTRSIVTLSPDQDLLDVAMAPPAGDGTEVTMAAAGEPPQVYTVGSSTNIKWHETKVGKEERERLLGQRGCVIWMTGLSGAGKSTLAYTLEHALMERRRMAVVLDGDNIRHGLNKNLGFSAADREENIRRVAEVAKLFADSGVVTIVSFISPYSKDRAAARALLDPGMFIEVFMKIPLAVCEHRDPKGLYKKARAGIIKGFTGIDDPYEEPTAAEVVMEVAGEEGAMQSPEAMAAMLIDYLEHHGFLPSCTDALGADAAQCAATNVAVSNGAASGSV